MFLTNMLEGMEYEIISGKDVDISNIQYDSRKAERGTLFVCIQGFKNDGHDFIKNAVEKEAAAILCEKEVACDENVTVVKVKDTRVALAKVAANFYQHPSKSLNLIGVTGTNGKTTTTYLLEAILKEEKRKTGIIGTIENKIGDKVLKTERTTPESLELQQLFDEMKKSDVTDVLMEVSSHSLELSRVEGLFFQVGIFTNLTQDHLDFHGTMENYINAKSKLFRMCKYGIVNVDDVYSTKIINSSTCEIKTVGIDSNCDFKAENIKNAPEGVSFSIKIDGKDEFFKLQIPGKFTVYNALGVIVASLSMGISLETIRVALENYSGVAGRIQKVPTNKDFSVIVDYAHTPDGLENVLKSVREFTQNKLITVFGCGGDRDKTKRPIMGNIAGVWSDYCIITSDNPRTENPADIINQVEVGVMDSSCEYEKFTDRREAIKRAIAIAKNGDIVVIAGKGHENYQIFANETIHFDDTEEVKKALAGGTLNETN